MKNYTLDEFKLAVKESLSWRQVIHKLGYSNLGGGNWKTVKEMAKNNNIDVSHFLGKGWNKDGPRPILKKEDVFKIGKKINGGTLKNNLLKYNIYEYKCNECGNSGEWMGKPIVLEVDHIDGNNRNNVETNLRLLCPNCHSQTPTFRRNGTKKEHVCSVCGAKRSKQSKSRLCVKCVKKNRTATTYYRKVKNRPQVSEIQEMIKEIGLRGVAEKYNVSTSCIRKWMAGKNEPQVGSS